MKRLDRNAIRGFYNGGIYPILVAALVLIGHTTGLDVLFGVIMFASLVAGLWICDDLLFAVMPFLCTILFVTAEHSPNVPSYSDYYLQPQALVPLAISLAAIVLSFVFFVKRNWKKRNPIKIKGIFLSIPLFCGALLTNGLFSEHYKISDLLFGGSFLLTLLLLTFLFYSFIRIEKGTARHLIYCLAVCSMLIAAELFVAYLTTVEFVNGAPVKESVVMGWGVWTSVGGMLAFLMPTGFYFAATSRKGWVGYLMGVVSLLGILLSQSRGALLVGCGIFLLCIILLCFIGDHQKRNRIVALSFLCIGVVGVLLLWNRIAPLIQNFIAFGFADNGRFEMWRIGIKHFTEYPVFGSGFYDSYYNEGWIKNVFPYLYHNTLVQLLASGGLVAILAYLYHRYTTFVLVFRRRNPCKIFLGIAILGLMLFCLLDVLFFHVYPVMYYSVMLVAMEISERECEQS